MTSFENWDFFQFSDSIYLVDSASPGKQHQTPSDNLIHRCIPKKHRTVREQAFIGLNHVEEKSITYSVRNHRIKRFEGTRFDLYEFHVGNTVWRMFMYKDPQNRFIVVLDIFESHKGKVNKIAKEKANSPGLKTKFEAAQCFSEEMERKPEE